MKNIAPIMWFLLMIVVGLAQLRLGYLGIEHHLGTVAAVILSIAAFLGILLPITIGSYFGAVDVMGWPIWVGLLVAVPGLFFATPMIMLNIIQSVVPIRTNRASDLAAVSLSESPSDEHRTMVDQTNRIQSSGERVDSPYRSEDKINEEFEKLAQYSSRLADIDDQLSEVPTRHRVEFRRSVLMSPSPLLHAAALAKEVLEKHNAELNPFKTKEANLHYQRCRRLLGEDAAEKFLGILQRLGDAADPNEVYKAIEQEVEHERRALALHLRRVERQRLQTQKRSDFFHIAIGVILIGALAVAAVDAVIGFDKIALWLRSFDPPPLKWSDLKYVLWHQGGSEHAKEEAHA